MKLKRIIGVVLMAIVLLNGMFFASENKVYAAEIEAGINDIGEADETRFMEALDRSLGLTTYNYLGENYLIFTVPESVVYQAADGNTVTVPFQSFELNRGLIDKDGNAYKLQLFNMDDDNESVVFGGGFSGLTGMEDADVRKSFAQFAHRELTAGDIIFNLSDTNLREALADGNYMLSVVDSTIYPPKVISGSANLREEKR